MDQKCESKKGGGTVVVAVVLTALLLPTVYVASAGPAAVMVVKGRISFDIYSATYAPLLTIEQWLPRASRAMDWWRSFFVTYGDWYNIVDPARGAPPGRV
jgi:hypothetical protein